MDKRHYVYLLRCADGSLYTGMTPDIARRLRQHVERLPGCAKYTRSHPVTALALLLTTDTATTARQLEARIKRLKRAERCAHRRSGVPARPLPRAGRGGHPAGAGRKARRLSPQHDKPGRRLSVCRVFLIS